MASPVAMTNLKVLHNVPLDNTYSDTIYFASLGAQTSYFLGKVKYSYTNCTYQRVNSSVAMPRIAYSMRVPEVADNLYDCNYIMFQNTGFGSKWFYGFIRQVNYINPNNTEIIYELDDYQTWAFDIQIRPSYIEREHSETDELYGNLLPEPVNESDMYTHQKVEMDMFDGYHIIIGVNADSNSQTVAGNMYGGVYSGVELHEFNDASSATNFIRSYDTTAKSEAIVCVFMSPFPVNGTPLKSVQVERPMTVNGYAPRNKKLLSYPFIKMTLTDRQGANYDLYYENFSDVSGAASSHIVPHTIQFNYLSFGGLNPKAFCVAVNYNGVQGSLNYDTNTVMELSGYPRCAWTSNAFYNWVSGEYQAQSQKIAMGGLFNTAGALLTGGANIAAGIGTSNPKSIASGAGDILGSFMQPFQQNMTLAIEAETRAKNPGLTKGSPSSTTLTYATGNVGFTVKQMAILPDIAASIDDFFDMFGYATNRVKLPNMTSRESWNYVKTKDIIIDGSIPVTAMATIKAMFNRGVRFWHGDYVGNYSRSNKCIKEVNADEK